MKKLVSIALALLFALSLTYASAAVDGFHTSYTYNYDYWEDIRESPDAYKVETVLYSGTLGLEVNLKKPQGLFVDGNDIYVCDTGNNRIIQITKAEGEYTVTRIIDRFSGAQPETFSSPYDVSVDKDGNIYVADYGNCRVVAADSGLNYLKQFTKPDDSTFDQAVSFQPRKIVTDVAGRVYVLAANVNKGLVKFEADTTFTGFIGANKVSYTIFEYVWKYFFLTEEQRSQTESFVPTEYANICIDEDGFIYATNTAFSEYDLKWDNAKPIRRLNGIGNDILVKNDRYPPIGDYFWIEGTTNTNYGPSKFIDITVLEDDVYVAFDATRGRLFGYDSQGVMLWAFGTKGNFEGAFISPTAIASIGRDLLCLDQNDNSITIFTPTEYGNLIYDANSAYIKGEYDLSAELWEQVLKQNANYNMAFRGVGRALLRQGKYSESMEYFEMAHDRKNYARAFRLYRKEWVEDNIGWMAIALGAVIVIWLSVRTVKSMKTEVAIYERDHVRK